MLPQELKEKANLLRQDIIRMLVESGSGHSAGPLGLADIFATLYFSVLNHDPRNPNWEDRDRLILSNGHVCPVLYTALCRSGYFPEDKLMTLRKFDSPLQGHPERSRLPGIETTSGPLGSGLAQAAGMSYAANIDNKNFFTYVVTSDGEHEEGNHWEAVLFAAKYKLSNLICIVDRNNIQISGKTEDILPLEPLTDKYKSFNWKVYEINGHEPQELIDAVKNIKENKSGPSVIIAHTVPGKGVSFMEGDYRWHGKAPTLQEGQKALQELQN